MVAGYSGTPLARKLGIKEGHRVTVLGGPEHFPDLLGELPAGARLGEGLPEHDRADVIVLFGREADALGEAFREAVGSLEPDGGLWVGWPKKSSSLETDLDKGRVRRIGLDAGLVDNKICAIDDDWSGLRFVYRVEDRDALR